MKADVPHRFPDPLGDEVMLHRSTKSTQAIGDNISFATFYEGFTMLNRISKFQQFLLALAAIMVVGIVGTSVASASLSEVGPTLTQASAKAETQVELRNDTGIQVFLGLKQSYAAKIVVLQAKRFQCRIGYSKLCPFNTGKNGWKLEQTMYRHGVVRWAYRVKFTYHGETRYVTFHELSSNILSGAKTQKHAQRLVETRLRSIMIRLLVEASASANAKSCGSTTVSANASAQLKAVYILVSPSATKGWTQYHKAVAGASAKVTVTCNAAPSNTPAAGCTGPNNTTATNSGVPCQSASQGSTQSAAATVTPSCTGMVANSCNTTININVTSTQTINQYNCSKVTQNYSDGHSDETWYAADGSVTTEQICSSQYNDCSQASHSSQCSETPPPGCTSDCTPPPPPTPGPLVDIVGAAHETFVNGHVAIFVKTKAASGHDATLDFQVAGGGVVSNKVPSNMYDKTSCPADWICYIARYDAPPYPVEDPNQVTITAVATQDDQQKATNTAQLYVIPDDF